MDVLEGNLRAAFRREGDVTDLIAKSDWSGIENVLITFSTSFTPHQREAWEKFKEKEVVG